MKKNIKGQLKRSKFNTGRDSNFRSYEYNSVNPNTYKVNELMLAEIATPQPEPAFNQHMVTVNMIRGGGATSVAWPGPHVSLNNAGIPGTTAQAIHGVYEAPMPGQMVLVACENGNMDAPMVVQKYPYNPSSRLDLKSAYTLPMTSIGHGPTDIAIGHYLGSYMALRGGPQGLPGSIDVKAVTQLNIESLETNITTDTQFNIESQDVNISAQNNIILKGNKINFGNDPNEPFVLGNILNTWITQLLQWLNTHVHSQPGNPPAAPMTAPGDILSKKIIGS